MYVKTSVRKTKSGEVRYLQLAHNEWDAATGRSVPKVLYSFGREDQLDKEAVRRLVASLSRLLEPGDALAADRGTAGLEFAESRPYGGAYVLDELWQRLGIGTILAGLRPPGAGRPRDAAAAERVLFALVANRALAPSSKLAAAGVDEPRRAHRRPRRGQRRRLLPGDGLAARRSAATWRSRCTSRSPTCSTSKSICCSSTPPPPISRPDEADEEVARNWRGEKPRPGQSDGTRQRRRR